MTVTAQNYALVLGELNLDEQQIKAAETLLRKIRCSPRCSLIPECALQRRKSAWTVFLRRPFPPL